MRRRRSVTSKFEKSTLAEKGKLEALLAELNAQFVFLNKAGRKMALLRNRIRQIDAEPGALPLDRSAAGADHTDLAGSRRTLKAGRRDPTPRANGASKPC